MGVLRFCRRMQSCSNWEAIELLFDVFLRWISREALVEPTDFGLAFSKGIFRSMNLPETLRVRM